MKTAEEILYEHTKEHFAMNSTVHAAKSDILKAMTAFASQSRWVPCAERLPEAGQAVLVWGKCCEVCAHTVVAEIEDGVWFESGTGEDLVFAPVFWQLLPNPPTENV